MRFEHQAAESGRVALLEQIDALQDALILSNGVGGPVPDGRIESPAVAPQVGPCDVPQRFYARSQDPGEIGRGLLAAQATLVVFRVDQGVLDRGIGDHEDVAWGQGHGFHLEGAEIGENQPVGAPIEAGNLVEQAAIDARVLVFGLLADAG